MKCLLDWFGYSEADLDVLFLHVYTPNKLFIKFTEVSRVRLNSGTGTEVVDWYHIGFASWENKKGTMSEGEELVELKFRIYDGTDIGHRSYASSTTVANLKQRLVAEWPQDKTITPKSANDVKLIHAGKILENNKTLADSRITVGDVSSGVTTMHVVIQPPAAKKKTDKSKKEMQKHNSCACIIL